MVNFSVKLVRQLEITHILDQMLHTAQELNLGMAISVKEIEIQY